MWSEEIHAQHGDVAINVWCWRGGMVGGGIISCDMENGGNRNWYADNILGFLWFIVRRFMQQKSGRIFQFHL